MYNTVTIEILGAWLGGGQGWGCHETVRSPLWGMKFSLSKCICEWHTQRLWRGKAKPTKASGLSERIPRGFIPEGASTSCHADEMAPHTNVLVKARLMNLAIPNVVVHIQSCKDTRKCGKRKENKTRRTVDRMVGCGEGRGEPHLKIHLFLTVNSLKVAPEIFRYDFCLFLSTVHQPSSLVPLTFPRGLCSPYQAWQLNLALSIWGAKEATCTYKATGCPYFASQWLQLSDCIWPPALSAASRRRSSLGTLSPGWMWSLRLSSHWQVL